MMPISYFLYIPEGIVKGMAYFPLFSYGTNLILISALGGLLFMQIFKGTESPVSAHPFWRFLEGWKFILIGILGILLIVGAINAHHDYFTPKTDDSFSSDRIDLD